MRYDLHPDRARRCRVPLEHDDIVRQYLNISKHGDNADIEMTRRSHLSTMIHHENEVGIDWTLTAGVTDLNTSLTNVDGDDFTHLFDEERENLQRAR